MITSIIVEMLRTTTKQPPKKTDPPTFRESGPIELGEGDQTPQLDEEPQKKETPEDN